MTELEKVVREALERIAAWNEHPPMLGVDYGSNGVRDYYRQIARDALTQALATTERTVDDVLRDIDAATCPECKGLGITAPGVPDSPDGPGRTEVPCKPCKGTGWRNGVHLSDQQPATTERKREPVARPVAWIHDWSKSSDQVGQILSWTSESPRPDKVTVIPLYTSPQVPEDTARLDWMASNEAHIGWNREGDACRVWAVQDEEKGAEPMTRWHASHRAAIDAARKEST